MSNLRKAHVAMSILGIRGRAHGPLSRRHGRSDNNNPIGPIARRGERFRFLQRPGGRGAVHHVTRAFCDRRQRLKGRARRYIRLMAASPGDARLCRQGALLSGGHRRRAPRTLPCQQRTHGVGPGRLAFIVQATM